MNLIEEIKKLSDPEFKSFHFKLVPTLDKDKIIGVRIPKLRSLAKEYFKNEDYKAFLNRLPHTYYEENMIHALLLNEMKDYEECIKYLDTFLPYIDNWAVCDSLRPKCFKKNKDKLLIKIEEWLKSKYLYEQRFGLEMIMCHYLDDNFKTKYLDMALDIDYSPYYLKLMIAWLFATSLAKQWDDTIAYLINNKLEIWTHNKTITKALESFRISEEDKMYLKTLFR